MRRREQAGNTIGRDFMRAYQSLAGAEMLQSISPAKSSVDRCAAAAKSASDMLLPASHFRVSASQPMY